LTDLEEKARTIRRHILTMVAGAQVAHVASALSCVEILVSLYFGHARVFPREPSLPGRDRIILSKGHAAAALYACLAERGFFPTEMLERFACNGSLLGEHPHFGDVPGVECTSGSLGHGLGHAVDVPVHAVEDDLDPHPRDLPGEGTGGGGRGSGAPTDAVLCGAFASAPGLPRRHGT